MARDRARQDVEGGLLALVVAQQPEVLLEARGGAVVVAQPEEAEVRDVVGARWGFADPAHFSRVFKAAYGMPPGVFRSAL